MIKANVFMIMPFEDEFFKVYDILKRKFEDVYVITHAGKTDNIQNILVDILSMMREADVVIADLTSNNPNVLYELGVAHALNKKVIIITRDDINELPFDLKSYRAKDYTTHFAKFDELFEFISDSIEGAINGNVKFGNPVSDFLELNPYTNMYPMTVNKKAESQIQERGFLDYLEEINQNSEELTGVITSISTDMRTMSAGIADSSQKIERLKSTGPVNPAILRSQTRIAASYIEEFSKKLRVSNIKIAEKWSDIEFSSSDLIDNKYASTEKNLPSLKGYLLSLHQLNEAIASSNVGVTSMKESAESIIGIEGYLNQAAKFLVADLSEYLSVTEAMQSSISKLLIKGKALFGDFE